VVSAFGLRWDAVDLASAELQVVRVAIEVRGRVSYKPYPKSKAGRRTVPLPPFLIELLAEHQAHYPEGPFGDVFTNRMGDVPQRGGFRIRVWRPSLVRAGLLGKVVEVEPKRFVAMWQDSSGFEQVEDFVNASEAIERVARNAPAAFASTTFGTAMRRGSCPTACPSTTSRR
jgi:hypothetical protein